MATYTVTKVTTRPNTSTQWPWESLRSGYGNLSEKVVISTSIDSDNLVQTSSFVWASKTDYTQNLRGADTRDSVLNTKQDEYNTYMKTNNITSRITEEDGTVRVFNSSNKTFEVE
jgi:hypothetical protein